jgi:hypothetical protein
MNLQGIIQRQLNSLKIWADISDSVSQKLQSLFDLLTAESLKQSIYSPFEGLSKINPNGLPFQWSFCINNQLPSVRFLCESGTPGTSVQSRSKLSLDKFNAACYLLNIPHQDWLHEGVLPYILPKNEEWPEDWLSSIWFAVGASKEGVLLKIYLNLDRGKPIERWKRIGWVLKSLRRDNSLERLCILSGRVSKDSWPSGLAVDILPTGKPGRVKIYFYSGEVYLDWLENWYSSIGAEREIPYLRKMAELFPWQYGQPYPIKALFLSLEFSQKDEVSLKTDLTVSRLIKNELHIVEGIRVLLKELKLDESLYISALKELGIWPLNSTSPLLHHLVGFGFEPEGSHHVNVYCEPPIYTKSS